MVDEPAIADRRKGRGDRRNPPTLIQNIKRLLWGAIAVLMAMCVIAIGQQIQVQSTNARLDDLEDSVKVIRKVAEQVGQAQRNSSTSADVADALRKIDEMYKVFLQEQGRKEP